MQVHGVFRDPLGFKTQAVFWLLCAPDGHAKNFSIAIEQQGRYRLTPVYDVLSAFPVLGHGAGKLAPEKVTMAMAAVSRNRHYRWAEILPRHWLATADACGIDRVHAQAALDDLVKATPGVLGEVAASLPPGFPVKVSEPILRGIEATCKRLAAVG
ncbi:MAG: HipA domain-containing protein [Rhodanobacteraceae bacterium]